MKLCQRCQTTNPPEARYCMSCGHPLPEQREDGDERELRLAGLNTFALSIIGSLLISLILIGVFGLPVFFLAAFLPLLWFSRK